MGTGQLHVKAATSSQSFTFLSRHADWFQVVAYATLISPSTFCRPTDIYKGTSGAGPPPGTKWLLRRVRFCVGASLTNSLVDTELYSVASS